MSLEILRPVFLCILLAGTVLPLFSCVAERLLMKKASASTKHRLWTLTAIGLLCFPVIVPLLRSGTNEPIPETPIFETEVAPIVAGKHESIPSFQTIAPVEPAHRPPVMETQAASGPAPVVLPPMEIEVTPKESVSKYVLNAATVLWIVGFCSATLYFLAIHFKSTLFLLRIQKERQDVSSDHPLAKKVRIRFSEKTSIPFAFGMFRPAVVFPSEAKGWSKEKFDAVLLHELAHITRRDLFWQNIVCMTCVLYWFHPFVWFVSRRIRIEQELACDDMVLESGRRSCDYASVLLELSKNLSANQPIPEGGLAMLRKKTVVQRIDSILDEKTSRKPISRKATLGILLGVLLLSLGISFFAPKITLPSFVQAGEAVKEQIFSGINEKQPEESDRMEAAQSLPESSKDKDGKPIAVAKATESLPDPHYLEKKVEYVPANSPEIKDYIDLNLMNTNCSIQMKKVQAALMDYHRETGRFPRPFTTDAGGKPLHSWRITILPYLGEKELFDKIRKDEPWNSEHNKSFHAQCPDVYQCPFAVKAFPELEKQGLTTYALVVGKTAYPTTEDLILGKNFFDGTANTLAIAERKSTVCWMDPAGDIPQDEAGMGINISPNGIGMYHDNQSERTAAACFFDGTVHYFQENLHVPALRAFLTPNGGESLAILYDDMVVIPDSQEPVFGVPNEENAEKLRKQNIELNVLYRFVDGNWINTKTEKAVTGVRLKADDITILLDTNKNRGRITVIRNDKEMFSYHSTLFATTPKPTNEAGERKSSFDEIMESFSSEDATAVSVQPGTIFNQDYEKKELSEVTGRVFDENGDPLEGILVQIQSNVGDGSKTIPGKEAKTNADGRFTLQGPFLITWQEEDGKVRSWSGPNFIFSGPGRERKMEFFPPQAKELNVTLNRGVSVHGRAIDDRTGKGAANVEVRFCSMTKPGAWPEMMTKTDAEGNYRTEFTLPQDRYVLFVFNQRDPKDETVGKLEDVEVTLDKPVFQAPDLHVNQCGWIEGIFVNAETKESVSLDSVNIDHVCTSKTRHKQIFTQQAYLLFSGSQFKAKTFPGENVLRILGGGRNGQIKGLENYCTKPIRVNPGETVQLQLEVMQAETAESLGKLPEPVEEEREAAEAVKRLGGWYKVDAENHVVEVNMVYRDLDDVRYDNAQTGTDAVMAFLPKFSRLKLLLICNGQATNASAVHFAKLENLESLYFWNAKIDDQGATFLGGLKKLRNIHLSEAGLTDASLEVFSNLPEIRELSLQGNRFTNRGLDFLRQTKTLEVLWWCRGETKPDDESLRILAEFPNLKELEIQGAEVTAVGFASLSKAPNLRKIWFSFPDDEKRPNHLRLSESLAKLKTLEYFRPDSLQFTPEEAKTLAKALPNLKELSSWDEVQLKRLRESD